MKAKLGFAVAMAFTTGAADLPPPATDVIASAAVRERAPVDRIKVLTYNVGALPWPAGLNRPAALARIGDRLAQLRRTGEAPDVVVLQEAFTTEAEAIGARAGYSYQVMGPRRDSAQPKAQPLALPGGRKLLMGEGLGPMLSSGLIILSDFRITAVRRAAFPTHACAGYDCLANKGVVAARLAVPGVADPVEIVTTHLNSGNPSGRPERENRLAFNAQMAALDRFFAQDRGPRRVIRIFAGDFNMGHSPARLSVLAGYIRHWKMKPATAMGRDKYRDACMADEKACRGDLAFASNAPLIHSNDWQFYPGDDSRLRPHSRSVSFGPDGKGKMLSDHMGLSVVYQFR